MAVTVTLIPGDGVGPSVAEVIGTGTLEARGGTTISAKISGRIEAVLGD